jgi:low affinity Fe/Cu permease
MMIGVACRARGPAAFAIWHEGRHRGQRDLDAGGYVGKKPSGFGQKLEQFSSAVTRWTGSTSAFAVACAVILVWLVSGPFFHFSDTWQLVINTGTTIVTFLMVFLIQRAQNKESLAVQLKLNELVAAVNGASNRLIDVEDLTEEELRTLHSYYSRLAAMASKDASLTQSHSIEEAQVRHERKVRAVGSSARE